MKTLAVGSPFPWSPGHVWMELELLCLRAASNGRNQAYIYPVLNSNMADAINTKLENTLESLNIRIASNLHELADAFKFMPLEDISLSHIKHIAEVDALSSHYKPHKNSTVFKDLCTHFGVSRNDFGVYACSNQVIHRDYNRYTSLYRSNPSIFSLKNSSNIQTSLLKQIKEDGREMVLINIREHVANSSIGMHASDYEAVVSYMKDCNYLVVDISHEQKSDSVRELCDKYGVIKYWAMESKSPLADFELFDNANYYLGSGGPSHLGLMLRVPTLWIGSLYPVHLAADFGYQVPCELYDKANGGVLNFERSFQEYLLLPELWDYKYDCWLKRYTDGNMHNCVEEMSHRYNIKRPSSIRILKAFRRLEKDIKTKRAGDCMRITRMKDLDANPIQTIGIYPCTSED